MEEIGMLNYEEFSKVILSYGSFSNKKLQKLCYYVYSWYLTLYNEKIADIEFEAWVHGPVSPNIYGLYRNYGWKAIPKYNGHIDVNKSVNDRIGRIISEYIDLDADSLELKTHEEDPWKNARIGYSKHESSNEIINDESIINFYQENELYNRLIES